MLPHQARKRHPQFFDQLVLGHRLAVIVLRVRSMPHDAPFYMRGREFRPDLIQRRANGGKLREDVDAILVFRNHPPKPPDLPLQTGQPPIDASLGLNVHALIIRARVSLIVKAW